MLHDKRQWRRALFVAVCVGGVLSWLATHWLGLDAVPATLIGLLYGATTLRLLLYGPH